MRPVVIVALSLACSGCWGTTQQRQAVVGAGARFCEAVAAICGRKDVEAVCHWVDANKDMIPLVMQSQACPAVPGEVK